MPTVRGYDGQPVEMRYSAGSGVPYLADWECNVLKPPDDMPWSPAVLKQVNAYVARRSWFAEEDAEVLAERLGRISKFQSLNSEDAVTWSWFGTLGLADADARRAVTGWLFDRLGISAAPSQDVRVDQWMRVVHPNAPESPNGPELDARIDDPSVALVYVEAKWDAELGKGKGSLTGAQDDQIVLRRDSMRCDPDLAADTRRFVVLGISHGVPDLTTYTTGSALPGLKPVTVKWLTWDDLAICDRHPRADEFRRYLDWKRDLIRPSSH